MNLNANERFALSPTIGIDRSRFSMEPEVKTSFNVSELVPLYWQEILPGDTFEIKTAMAVRMQPLVSAPMDNLHLTLTWMFIPNRLVWDHWKEFMGENTQSAWIPTTEYTVPQVGFYGGCTPYSVADYLGLPTMNQLGDDRSRYYDVSVLPFRAYTLCYNEWWRNQNLQDPAMLHTDDTYRICPYPNQGGDLDYDNPIQSAEFGGKLFKVTKSADYFTKALPGPQKHEDIYLMEKLPVYFGEGRSLAEVSEEHKARTSNIGYAASSGADLTNYVSQSWTGNHTYAQPLNWFVDGNLTISALRTAFQIQKLYEADSRGGSRYVEQLKQHFHVNASDQSLQRPQFLGSKSIPININSVIQTSETGNTPQGNIAGYSITSHGTRNSDFIQSFTEHGILMCFAYARIDEHTYQNGIHKSWSRKNRLDYYYPVLSNLSEMPIKNRELFTVGHLIGSGNTDNSTDDEVFGYQEAWAEYRYAPSYVTSEMRSNVTNSLDSWHFADDYQTLPSLSSSWIEETKENVDRTLAVSSSVSNQLFGDFKFYIKATRPMPMYSIPGWVDHH